MLKEAQLKRLEEFRKQLHTYPELSGKEFETQRRIIDFLNLECKAEVQTIAETGVIASFQSNITGPTVMIRCDIDALPIHEINTFDHKSSFTGISHKCGHDGHTSIALGLALILSEKPIARGKVILLFQPAEENGTGAEAVLKDDIFNELNIDYAFALHNLPGYPMHQIVVKSDAFTANVKSLILKLNGKTSHAAEPEKGINPSSAIYEILDFANRLTFNDPSNKDFFLMTPVYSKLGNKNSFGVSAGDAEMHFTIRSWSTELMHKKSQDILDFINTSCQKHQLKHSLEWTEVFYANNNHSQAVAHIKNASVENKLKLNEKEMPFTWGEDFGIFTQKYKGAMFGLGSGTNTPALHNPDYDYPDEITITGIRMFYSIILQII